MIYTCKACKFTFERISEIEQCPDCGKLAVRPATYEEIKTYETRYESKYNFVGISKKKNVK